MLQDHPGEARPLSRLHRHFPWRQGNRFELLIDGHVFLPRMLAVIEAAQQEVLLELYLVESGVVSNRFIDALVAAVARGVSVCLLLDAFGGRGLSRVDRARLVAGGVKLVFYNPLRFGKLFANLARDHRKLLVVDGNRAFVGGAGLTDDFDPPGAAHKRWHEVVLEIAGPVVDDWRAAFGERWRLHAGEALALKPAPPAFAEGALGRVVLAHGPRHAEIQRAVIKRTRSASRRVWIMTAYFVPSWRLRRALGRAASRGVDVRLLVPGPISDHPGVRQAGRRFYSRLLAHGVRIYEYQPRFLHAKCVLADDWVSIGSTNLDRWNIRWNLEGNQEARDARLAQSVQEMFEADFQRAVECRHQQWRLRSWQARARERFWGQIDRLLHRLGRGREEE